MFVDGRCELGYLYRLLRCDMEWNLRRCLPIIISEITSTKFQCFLEFFHYCEDYGASECSLDHSYGSVAEARLMQIRIVPAILRTILVNNAFVVLVKRTGRSFHPPSSFIVSVTVPQVFLSQLFYGQVQSGG